jgi:hypothetical protein
MSGHIYECKLLTICVPVKSLGPLFKCIYIFTRLYENKLFTVAEESKA